jgi:hypothetical protein
MNSTKGPHCARQRERDAWPGGRFRHRVSRFSTAKKHCWDRGEHPRGASVVRRWRHAGKVWVHFAVRCRRSIPSNIEIAARADRHEGVLREASGHGLD